MRALGSCEFFTIRPEGNGNGSESIRWAAVVGLEEAFTAEELLSFPVFILRNHGPAWNDLATAWLQISWEPRFSWLLVYGGFLRAAFDGYSSRVLTRLLGCRGGGAHSPSVRPESSVICRLRPVRGTLP